MTDKTDRVSRSAIERELHELGGFRADATEIARIMVIIDTYAALQATETSESHVHLLIQLAEQLLDSRVVVADVARDVSILTARVGKVEQDIEDLAAPLDQVEAVVLSEAERQIVRDTLEAEIRAAEAADELTRLGQEIEIEHEEFRARVAALVEETGGKRGSGATAEILCHHCGQWKDTSHFYRNQKSRTGFETRCRECRPPKVKAA